MCGISGVAGRPAVEPSSVLAHRGPDGSAGVQLELGGAPAMLHHTRLAIVDLSEAGDQPMADESGRLVMVFNGEIYNHAELREECIAKGYRFRSDMDGEVILPLWQTEGPACLARLNGIFAVAIADTESGELFLARDPLGVKPVVYADGGDGSITFASEPSAIAALGADIGAPDLVGLASYLTFLWVPAPRTLFSGVRSLPPGHLLRWRDGEGTTMTPFRELVPEAEMVVPRSMSTARDELAQQLDDATRRQLLGDVPISVMASGGVDSSLIWSSAGSGVDRAYTIRWPQESGEGAFDDAAAVERIEGSLGTPVAYLDGADADHQYLPISGDLYADPAYELTRLIARRTRQEGRKVLLSGQGGDELFGGYRRHMIAPLLGRTYTGAVGSFLPKVLGRLPRGMSTEFVARLSRASRHRDPFLRYMELCTYSDASDRARVLGCSAADVSDDVVFESHRARWDALPDGLSFLRRCMALDLGVYLPGLGLGYVDRAGMEFGVEIRVPWLDLDLVEWSFTLPDELLVSRAKGKLLPKELARSVLPPEIVDRPKRGFGAPTTTLATAERTSGSRGHRQGEYFALASNVLDRWTPIAAEIRASGSLPGRIEVP